MSAGAVWVVAGLVLAGLEMLAPGVFLLWIGLAAIGTGAVAEFSGMGWHGQLALFVGLTVVLVGGIGVRGRRRPGVDLLNAPSAGLVGQRCRAILFQEGEGRVALGDGQWSARTADGGSPEPGQTLRVVGLEGTVLLVAAG